MGAVHHAASSEFVKAGTVGRTTVEDRMNEYVHEWAMQRERECRGSANSGKQAEGREGVSTALSVE